MPRVTPNDFVANEIARDLQECHDGNALLFAGGCRVFAAGDHRANFPRALPRLLHRDSAGIAEPELRALTGVAKLQDPGGVAIAPPEAQAVAILVEPVRAALDDALDVAPRQPFELPSHDPSPPFPVTSFVTPFVTVDDQGSRS
jgi:hypothetical protein